MNVNWYEFRPCASIGRELKEWEEIYYTEEACPPLGSVMVSFSAPVSVNTEELCSRVAEHAPHAIAPPPLSELWITAPCRIPLLPLTICNIVNASPILRNVECGGGCDNDMQTVVKFMQDVGMWVMPAGIPPAVLPQVRRVCAQRIHLVSTALQQAGFDLETDTPCFQEVSWRGKNRFDMLFPVEPLFSAANISSELVGSGSFHRLNFAENQPGWGASVMKQIAWKARWLPIVLQMLQMPVDRLEVTVGVVTSRPGANVQAWHSDGQHVDEEAGWDGTGEAPPRAVCVFVPLVDLNRQIGCTQFFPGSHKYSGLLGLGGAAVALGSTADALCMAGDALMYDYRVLHRGMPNCMPVPLPLTSDQRLESWEGLVAMNERPILQFIYHAGAYRQTKNFSREKLLP